MPGAIPGGYSKNPDPQETIWEMQFWVLKQFIPLQSIRDSVRMRVRIPTMGFATVWTQNRIFVVVVSPKSSVAIAVAEAGTARSKLLYFTHLSSRTMRMSLSSRT